MRKLFAVVIVILMLLPACSRPKNYPVNVGGTEIMKYPEAVVTLSPYIGEIIYGLKQSRVLVGRSEYCDYNGNVRQLPSMGTVSAPDVDAIIALAPQVVFAAVSLPQAAAAKLAENNIKVCVLPVPATIEEIKQRVTEIAKVLRGVNRAEALAKDYLADFEQKLNYVTYKLQNVDKPTGIFVLSNQGAVATGDTLAGVIMQLAGVTNIAANNTGYSMPFTEIFAANPDVIIVSNPPAISYIQNSDFSQLAAASAGRIYELDNSFAEKCTPAVTDMLYALAYAIHGDAMAAPDTDSAPAKPSEIPSINSEFQTSSAVLSQTSTAAADSQQSSSKPSSR
ncbi:MAG TPA: ABC transporter substrate-binding protein [Oscillospiraceae bacterium]|nr:ABC transporter substrate-binding protein [Oscillospiraceae bacterium]HPS35402.1 ABC transporter substrate-binding protein [Oscillospiraceae bacterium]